MTPPPQRTNRRLEFKVAKVDAPTAIYYDARAWIDPDGTVTVLDRPGNVLASFRLDEYNVAPDGTVSGMTDDDGIVVVTKEGCGCKATRLYQKDTPG